VTGEVLVAAAGEDFPVAVAPRAPKPTTESTATAPAPTPTLPPVPIPGVSSPPATPVPGFGSGSGGSGSGSGGGSTGHAGPLVPGATAPPPVGGAGAILPPASSTQNAPEDLVEASPAASVGPDPDDPASPWIPIGIGLGVGLLALVVPLLLGRRYAW
jgi:hypothetical protein